MQDVAIIGAGELGGALAHGLARRGLASTIRLIDEHGRIAEGKALDILQSAPIERFSTTLTGSTDLTAAAGAAVIIIADRAIGGEWRGDDAWLLLKRLAEVAARRIVLCAGASQRELVERGVRELRFSRTRLFGSAPEAMAGAARAMVALETHGSPRDVALSIVGVPPSHLVVPWDAATVGGFAIADVLDASARRRIADRLSFVWPPGPHALASAAAKVLEGVFGRTRALASCFVAPDDSAGRRARAAALPVRLGPDGIASVHSPSLSARDRVALDNAMLL